MFPGNNNSPEPSPPMPRGMVGVSNIVGAVAVTEPVMTRSSQSMPSVEYQNRRRGTAGWKATATQGWVSGTELLEAMFCATEEPVEDHEKRRRFVDAVSLPKYHDRWFVYGVTVP